MGSADDPLEREADRASDHVMRSGPAPAAGAAEAKTEAAPAAGVSALDGRGAPLPDSVRTDFESRFNHSFAQVRIHDDRTASKLASDVSARAFTIGPHIVFGQSEYHPHDRAGQKLLAHELAHVVQQGAAPRGGGDGGVSLGAAPSGLYLARTPLDVTAIRTGIEASVAPITGTATPPSAPAAQSGDVASAFAAQPCSSPVLSGETHPRPDPAPVPIDRTLPLQAHFFPAARTTYQRALVLGGFHGDERPGVQLAEETIAQLGTPGSALANSLAFHTLIIPRVNPGGVADELAGVTTYDRRCNRQLVDLNRNFPTVGSPSSPRCANTATAPTQPEAQGVMDVVKQFQPDRILSTHAISSVRKAGVYADPNRDPAATELACAMAREITDPSNRLGNRLSGTSCNAIYPGDTAGATEPGTLGGWAPTSVAGRTSSIPTITMEAPTYRPLAATGVRSVPSFMAGVSRFLTEPDREDREIIHEIEAFSAADRVLFLTGRIAVANAIYDRIRARIEQRVEVLNGLAPPERITIHSGRRAFGVPAEGNSAQAQIVFEKFFLTGGRADGWDSLSNRFRRPNGRVDRDAWLKLPSADRFNEILRFSSLPGTSRHHWGTDVDFNSTTNTEWEPPTSTSRSGRTHYQLGRWLAANAPTAGFVLTYTPRPASGAAGRMGGYDPEPWHYSYAPIAAPLRTMFNNEVNLTTDIVDAIVAEFTTRAGNRYTIPNDLRSGLLSLNISTFVNSVGPGL